MLLNNEYPTSGPYSAYLRYTDEKVNLLSAVIKACKVKEFPIQKKSKGSILDIGSGSGINSFFLADYFPNCEILGIEPSKAQYDAAISSSEASRKNVKFKNVGLEDFMPGSKQFDFILLSHILQYLPKDVTVEVIVKKVCEMLKPGGQAWFIQHMRAGFAQIIFHMAGHLKNSRFQKWKTFEDYVPEIEDLATKLECTVETEIINCSIAGLNTADPSTEDKERLKFMLLLEKGYDAEPFGFKKRLAQIRLNRRDGRIYHPNGILKIKNKK
jgi:SAM-dependent methyltransferase